MANDFLAIQRQGRTNLGSQLVSLANALRDVRDKCDALNDAASHMHDGATYTTVESQFGITAGQGANFVSLMGLLNNILNTNVTVAGTDRLAQLDEFVARLAGQ